MSRQTLMVLPACALQRLDFLHAQYSKERQERYDNARSEVGDHEGTARPLAAATGLSC